MLPYVSLLHKINFKHFYFYLLIFPMKKSYEKQYSILQLFIKTDLTLSQL